MTGEDTPFFDRFDICEAWAVWAHDWGEYDVTARLARMGFRFGVGRDHYERLEDNGRLIYAALEARSRADPDWHARMRHSTSDAE